MAQEGQIEGQKYLRKYLIVLVIGACDYNLTQWDFGCTS